MNRAELDDWFGITLVGDLQGPYCHTWCQQSERGRWYRHLTARVAEPENISVTLARDFPRPSPETYSVLPGELPDRIVWLDAAGYRLADSPKPAIWNDRLATRHDYDLNVRQHSVVARPY